MIEIKFINIIGSILCTSIMLLWLPLVILATIAKFNKTYLVTWIKEIMRIWKY